MTKEERELSIEYLEKIKEDYIEGNAYERHPLPEYYAIENAIKALEQEPSKGTPYIQTIYTEALEEGIRCAMCTNTMKSERGCDGGCVVDEKMYKKVLAEINSRLLRQSPQTEQENPMAGIDLDNATNGDVMMAIFKEIQYYSDGQLCSDWWNELYQGGQDNGKA